MKDDIATLADPARRVPAGQGLGVAPSTTGVSNEVERAPALERAAQRELGPLFNVSGVQRSRRGRQWLRRHLTPAWWSGVETVMVGHSLGSVVSYHLLRAQGHLRQWRVTEFITVGSPLAVTEIKNTLRRLAGPARCPRCVEGWFNAMDERDVVSLYPLDPAHFPINPAAPAIINKRDVRNRTRNRHGIGGYLDDQEVARRIHDALME